jgi:hypothetical protein
MKLSGWKDIAEIVALTAVVGGLAAVVIELRQTQAALMAQTYQARALDVINTLRNPIIVQINHAGEKPDESP